MTITIIGTGNMAKGLAARFLAGGHTVEVHARDKAKGEALKSEAGLGDVQVVELGAPVGDIVIPAVHYGEEMQAVADQYAAAADGKIVIDITNPLDFNTFQLIPDAGTSGAESVAKLFTGATVVKAFNTIFASTLLAGEAGGQPLDVFIAGDDETAKQTVAEAVTSGGMRPLDVGPLANARHLEGFGLIHMTLQEQVKGNWATGLKIVG